MKKLLQILFLSLLSAVTYGQDCIITWDCEHMTMPVMNYDTYTFLSPGDAVSKGTKLALMPTSKSGYELDTFNINGEDVTNDVQDYEGDGQNYQYSVTAEEDINIVVKGKQKKYAITTKVNGGGKVTLIRNGEMAESGVQITQGETIVLNAIPDEGNYITKVTVDGTDYLDTQTNEVYTVMLSDIQKPLIIEASFTGDDKPEQSQNKLTWNTEGDGTFSITTNDGKELNSGDIIETGTEITIKAVPEDLSDGYGFGLRKFTINGNYLTKSMRENNFEYTTTVETAMIIEAVFKKESGPASDNGLWTDKAADSYYAGKGSKESPYLIATAEQLALLAKNVDDGQPTKDTYYELAADIDLGGRKWYPIGYMSQTKGEKFFDGVFNGNGHSIKNLTISQLTDITSAGLFGLTSGNAQVKNLTIESGDIEYDMLVGAVAGYNRGLIENCTNYADVSCAVMYCGGIAGGNSNDNELGNEGIIRQCINYGEIVAGTGTNGMGAAGIAGSSYGIIEKCINYGNVKANTACAGGIVSTIESGTVRNCYNRGSVSAPEQTGGLVGAIYGRGGDVNVKNCYSAANVTQENSGSTGGLFGLVMFIEPKNFNTGNLYYDKDLCTADVFGSCEDIYGTFTLGTMEGLTTSEMKSADFIDKINEGLSKAMWSTDTEGINDGYAVLRFQVETPVDNGLWTDMAADNYNAGDGTEKAPYQIATAEQLALLAKNVDDGQATKDTYYELTADIDLGGRKWYPIGYRSQEKGDKQFEGVFNGNGHNIKNITISQLTDITSAGLFGLTSGNAQIKNLTIESGKIEYDMLIGAVAGYNRGLIEDCVNYADVSCAVMYCGGIAGGNSNDDELGNEGIIRQCINYGEIIAGIGTNGMGAAGIAGSNYAIIEECVNYGNVKANTACAGGIVSTIEGGTVRNCYNRGEVSAPEQTGGVAGAIYGRGGNVSIENCYSAAKITQNDPESTGGILGLVIFIEPNSFNAGNLYYDTDLCQADAYGSCEDIYGTFTLGTIEGLTTSEMNTGDFVEKMNNGLSEAMWNADSEGINDGYAVLKFQGGTPTGINSNTAAEGITVRFNGNTIEIEGCKADETVSVFSINGAAVFKGTAATLNNKTLAKGIYIINIGEESYKISMK